MEDNIHTDELQHWGIKGQRWGVRRYQNADGSLTPRGQKRYNKEVEKLKKETAKVKAAEKEAANRKKVQSKFDALDAKKQALEERKKALKGDKDKKDDEQPEETVEQKRERLLKSSDPKEIYEGRDALTYQELNDRVNRIDLETRLQNKIPKEEETSALDRMDNVSNAINKATNLYKSIDGAYSTVKNSAIGKTLAKSLGIETETKKDFNLHDFVANRHKKSAQEMMDARKWHQAEQYLLDADKQLRSKEKEEAKQRKEKEEKRKAEVKEAKENLDIVKALEKDYEKNLKDAKARAKAAKEDLSYVSMPIDLESAEADLRDARELVKDAKKRLRKAEKQTDD